MKIVVLSGKGGTGKTTIAISLTELIEDVVPVDCDVDAANMYMYFKGSTIEEKPFLGNRVAFVDEELCTQCGVCDSYCKFDSIESGKVNHLTCEGCGVCKLVCPNDAIELKEIKSANLYVTDINRGVVISSKMEVGSEGSGLLISELKKLAKKHTTKKDITIIDGSPGIGCPVISSITGCDMALLVVEPTKSGLKDFLRINELCAHFQIPALVCINKYDLNEEISKEIEDYCKNNTIKIVGRIPFDTMVVDSINDLKPIVSYKDSIANKAIRELWGEIEKIINQEVLK